MAGKTMAVLSILFLALLTSCRPDDSSSVVEENAGAGSGEPRRILAECLVDGLRVRSMPYLDQKIQTVLDSGDVVVVESRTEWTQKIGNHVDYWYFVRTELSSGWTFGGYLTFTAGDKGSVPINPAISEPVVTESSVADGPLSPADLPEIIVPVFGMAGSPPSFEGVEGTIGYDPAAGELIIPFQSGAGSVFADFAKGIGSIHLVAKHISGFSYDYLYMPDDTQLYSETWGFLDGPLSDEALLLPFYPLACIKEGSWEFYAFSGNDGWPAATGRADITPLPVSLSAVEDPVPMADSPHIVLSPGDTAFCIGCVEENDFSGQVALYHDTEESRSGQVLLRAEAAARVESSRDGLWRTSFPIGNDMPKGRYWVAVGDPIEDSSDVMFFLTSLVVVEE